MSTGELQLLRVVIHGDEDDDSPMSVLRSAADRLSECPEQRVFDMTFEYDVMDLRWVGYLYFAME
ncbi:hypothetical protein [Streptomyces hundungensis]|uniref:hypothetical protein n=1 Tax=Streptomyces hundungensis TaxID=1077946 RepID=UPI0033E5C902